MGVTPQEARDMLGQTDTMAALMRNHSMYRRIGPILIVWGVLWLVCFPLTALLPKHSGWIWLIGDGIGFAGSFLAARRSNTSIRSASSAVMRSRILWFWLAFLAYGCFWMFLIAPAGDCRAVVFIVTLIMFAYVAIGILSHVQFMTYLGLGVTLLAITGFVLFANQPQVLNVWMGASGGLTLLATGFFITLRAR